MQRSKITSSLKMGKSGLYNENKLIRLMKIAVILLEQKRKKTSPIVTFELEKKMEKNGETKTTAMGRNLPGKKYWVRIFILSVR